MELQRSKSFVEMINAIKNTLEDCFYNLDKIEIIFEMSWIGLIKQKCDQFPKAIYRSGSSVYKPIIFTSLFIPLDTQNENIKIIYEDFMKNHKLKNECKLLRRKLLRINEDERPQRIKEESEFIIDEFYEDQAYKPEEVEAVLNSLLSGDNSTLDIEQENPKTPEEYKKAEYKTLLKENNSQLLKTRILDIKGYSQEVNSYLKKLVVVDSLIETKVLYDFTRSKGEVDLDDISNTKLWKTPQKKGRRWLGCTKQWRRYFY